MMRLPSLFAMVLGLFLPGLVRAAATGPAAKPVVFASGESRTRLIELFTSEGCSSCPPAEDWLARLRGEPRLWRDFVPVSFHVVYWDNLGWPDRFATKAFTARQYALAASWSSGQVYTPCFALDGAEWQSLGARTSPPAVGQAGVLRVEYAAEGTARVTFSPAGATSESAYDVQLAFLGGGISTEVQAGENAGHILRHEFVALSLDAVPLKHDAGGWRATTVLAKPTVVGVKDFALAAWVTAHGKLAPVQATGGWLP